MLQHHEDHLPKYRVRPRFQVFTISNPQELSDKIKVSLEQKDAPCKGKVTTFNYATLYLPFKDQHYWSPQLSLTFEKKDDGCLLRGLYGPRPAVWTMFVFFYCILGFAVLVTTIVGLSYVMLDLPAPMLWLIPLLVLAFLSLYIVAYLGQKKGHDQMLVLHNFLEDAIGLEIVDQE